MSVATTHELMRIEKLHVLRVAGRFCELVSLFDSIKNVLVGTLYLGWKILFQFHVLCIVAK